MFSRKDKIQNPLGLVAPPAWKLCLMLAWGMWWGGLCFYAVVVVPIGTEDIGSVEPGFITQRVTQWHNALTGFFLVGRTDPDWCSLVRVVSAFREEHQTKVQISMSAGNTFLWGYASSQKGSEHGQGRMTLSSPLLVRKPANVRRSIFSEKNWAEPSTITTIIPPGWNP